MRLIRSLPPLELALGVSPSQAANCRPDVNWCGSLTVAARADAVMIPIPGRQLSRPEMARGAGFHTNKARFKLTEERDHLSPTLRFADENFSVSINRMYLKNVLRQVQTDRGNLHSGWLLLLVVVMATTILAPRCREREPSTPSAFGGKADSI